MQVRVVRGVEVDGVGDRRARRLSVQQRGVDLQRHAELEAVDDDPGDLRPILVDLGLAFDHRGDDDHLVRAETELRGLRLDLFLADDEVHEVDHSLGNVTHCLVRGDAVGVGEEQPFQ